MALFETLSFIFSHPLARRNRWRALSRFARWQIGCRILPHGTVVDFVGGTRLLVYRSMTGATGNVYVGIHDFEEMGFLLHFLRGEDLFVDVGANVGSYTVLAAGVCGARVRAFEPISATFEHLLDNIALNRLGDRVVARRAAVGAASGSLEVSSQLDTVNYVIGGHSDDGVTTETVPQVRLDDELDEVPALVKIDVEGFESHVLEGMPRILEADEPLAVIMELNGSGVRYGIQDHELRSRMSQAGLLECSYDPFRRALEVRPDGFDRPGNSIFIRRRAVVEDRLASAPEVVVHGVGF